MKTPVDFGHPDRPVVEGRTLFKRLFGSKSTATQAPVVVVSGLPRSGTSMMMKMLEAGGVPVLIDGIRGADSDNPKGYYEYERVKQLDKGDTAWVVEARGKAVKVIAALVQHLPADSEYRVIFMARDINEVLASQRKMLQNRDEDPRGQDVADAEMAALFARHVEQVRTWMAAQPNIQVLDIDYNAMLADPGPFVERVAAFLPMAVETAAMAAIVDPALYRNRNG